MIKSKYESVLTLGEQLQIKNGDIQEDGGVLKIKGVAKNMYEKNLLWNEIKRVGGENPTDLVADIDVEDESVYAMHEVKSGDSLSKIAKHYYGSAGKFNAIFQANTDLLKNPDIIHPGQVLKIPNI